MPTKTPEERLSLIEQALFPEEPFVPQSGFTDVLDYNYGCECDNCDAPASFEDALTEARIDGALQAFESLTIIAQSGANADAVAASEILLEFSLGAE